MAPHFLAHQGTTCGFVCLQTDDSACGGNSQFILSKTKVSFRFASKCSIFLKDGFFVQFNSTKVGLNSGIYAISQPNHIPNLKCISEQNRYSSDFVSERARGAYIEAMGRPDLTFVYTQASQFLSGELMAFKELNAQIKHS